MTTLAIQSTFDFAKQSVDELECVLEMIPLDTLPANDQLTTSRPNAEIKELAQSIGTFGVLVPVIVAEYSDGRRVLKDGTARVLASRMLDRPNIRAEVFKKAELVNADLWTVIVNNRRSKNFVAELDIIQSYYDGGMGLTEITRITGLKKQELERLLKLNSKLAPELKEAVREKRMTVNTAFEVTKLGPGFQAPLIQAASEGKKVTADMVHEARAVNAVPVIQAMAQMLPMDLPKPIEKPKALYAIIDDADLMDLNAAKELEAQDRINGITTRHVYKLEQA